MTDRSSGDGDAQSDIVYLHPDKQQISGLKSEVAGISHMNDLVVFDDVLDIRNKRDGYIVARSEAFSMQGNKFDLAAAHLFSETAVPDFYNIPIVSSYSGRSADLFQVSWEHFCATGYSRCMLRFQDELLMVDIVSGDRLEQKFTPYFVSNLDDIAETEGLEGRALKLRVDEILKELGVRY